MIARASQSFMEDHAANAIGLRPRMTTVSLRLEALKVNISCSY
jgi:hypothetical protein